MQYFYQKLLNFTQSARKVITQRVEDFGAQYIAFGVFGVLNYPVFYLIWHYYDTRSYENLGLRLTASILCVILLLKNYWPKKIKPWFPIYWYFTLLFCLPFFFFFMLFKNNGASVWLMSSNTILFWLLLMVDWLSYIAIFSLGIGLAYLTYLLTTSDAAINIYIWWGVIAQFIASFIVVAFFAHSKQQFDRQKLNTIATIGESIAHELRTPLRVISSAASGLNKYLPQLIETYTIAKTNNLPIPAISNVHYKALKPALSSIGTEVESAFNFINMLLMNANQSKINESNENIYSIGQCVNDALLRYPFDLKEQ